MNKFFFNLSLFVSLMIIVTACSQTQNLNDSESFGEHPNIKTHLDQSSIKDLSIDELIKHGQMLFDETLILHKVKTDYIHKEVQQMIDTMNSDKIPNSHTSCENCAYARQRSVIDKLK